MEEKPPEVLDIQKIMKKIEVNFCKRWNWEKQPRLVTLVALVKYFKKRVVIDGNISLLNSPLVIFSSQNNI